MSGDACRESSPLLASADSLADDLDQILPRTAAWRCDDGQDFPQVLHSYPSPHPRP